MQVQISREIKKKKELQQLEVFEGSKRVVIAKEQIDDSKVIKSPRNKSPPPPKASTGSLPSSLAGEGHWDHLHSNAQGKGILSPGT